MRRDVLNRRLLSQACWALAAASLGAGLLDAALADGGAPAPAVTSVNAQKGDVLVPANQRQASTAIDATPGAITWTFPQAFASTPTCYHSLVAGSATYSYDEPVVTAISAAAVSYRISAHPSSLSITSLVLPVALPLTQPPPAGTTITLTCLAPAPNQ